MKISEQTDAWLLQLARRSIEHYLETKELFGLQNLAVDQTVSKEVEQETGAFVVLELMRQGKKKRTLRGQSGTFESVGRIDSLISQLAVNAAFFDVNTPRLKAYELNDLIIHLFLPTELKSYQSLDSLLSALQGNPELGLLTRAYNRLAYDLPILRDSAETIAHKLRRLRLQIGVGRSSADQDIEYYTFEGKRISELTN